MVHGQLDHVLTWASIPYPIAYASDSGVPSTAWIAQLLESNFHFLTRLHFFHLMRFSPVQEFSIFISIAHENGTSDFLF
jgi:hypothetical protein